MNSVKNRTNVSLVVPAYNEENRIATMLSQYCSYFPDSEIIVVCDGADSTQNIVKSLSKDNKNIKLLHFNNRVGKGGAIIEGFKIATGDIIGFVDADESVKPSQVIAMIDELSNADGVIASRHLNDSKIIVKQPLKRRFASKCFNFFVRLVFNLPFKDTQSGFWIISSSLLDQLTLNETSFFLSSEIKMEAFLIEPTRCAEERIPYFQRKVPSKSVNKLISGLKIGFFVLKRFMKQKKKK